MARGTALDAYSSAYARLLSDPCAAPLTSPSYIGGDAGILSRFETDYLLFNNATDTAGTLIWTPGGIGTTGTLASHLFFTNAATSAAFATSTALSNASAPGLTFLANSAVSARCVAACMQVYWPGSEANRSGIVYTGVVNGGAVVGGTGVSADGVGSACQFVDRMPAGMIETKWRPADGDQISIPVNTNTAAAEIDKRNAIVLAIKGIPNSTGVRVRLVAVYEWTPGLSQGFVTPITTRSWTGNSLTDVLNYLDARYPNWFHNAGNYLSGAASSAVMAVAYNTNRLLLRN
jgi:hypothetical protein